MNCQHLTMKKRLAYGFLMKPQIKMEQLQRVPNSLFGSYAESVQLNKDQTFIPVTWFDKNAFELKTPEAGNFEYLSSNKLLFKDGLFDFECDIIKFENDDLWLKMFDITYKFKRQF